MSAMVRPFLFFSDKSKPNALPLVYKIVEMVWRSLIQARCNVVFP